MGVWAASQVLSKVSLPIRRRIAINGTPFPIDEKRGIPPAIFMGTLEGLNEASLRKFQRRMCADGNVFARFQLTAPERSIEELKEELAAVAEQYRILPTGTFAWEQAIIGESDRIFPPTNQRAAWKGISMSNIDGNEAHYDESLFIKYLKEI